MVRIPFPRRITIEGMRWWWIWVVLWLSYSRPQASTYIVGAGREDATNYAQRFQPCCETHHWANGIDGAAEDNTDFFNPTFGLITLCPHSRRPSAWFPTKYSPPLTVPRPTLPQQIST